MSEAGKGRYHHWTDEEKAFIRENAGKFSERKIARMIQEKYGFVAPAKSVHRYARGLSKDFVADWVKEKLRQGDYHLEPGANTTCKKNTKCWDCAHAVPNYKEGHGCEWSIAYKPVPGWNAELRRIRISNSDTVVLWLDSYYVEDCPKFELDEDVKRYREEHGPIEKGK